MLKNIITLETTKEFNATAAARNVYERIIRKYRAHIL